MKIAGREQLRNQLKNREFSPVYVLIGQETFLRDLAAKTIADLALEDAQLREFNEVQHSLNESSIGRAVSDAEQLPMMAARRVVTVSNFLISSSGKKENLKDEDEEILVRYLENPSDRSVLILLPDEFDKRRKISKVLAEKAFVVEFNELVEPELTKWVKSKFAENGAEAEPTAVALLIDLIGSNLRRLSNEISKLSVAALPDKLVTKDLVSSLVASSREMENFELTNRLMEKNARKTIEILSKILDDGAEPLMLLGLIANNYRQLALAKELVIQGKNPGEIRNEFRLPNDAYNVMIAAARRTDRDKVTQLLKRIADTDLAIKTSRGGGGKKGSRLQIEMLVYELLSI